MNLAGPFKGNDILGSSSDPNYEETIFLSLSFWMGEGWGEGLCSDHTETHMRAETSRNKIDVVSPHPSTSQSGEGEAGLGHFIAVAMVGTTLCMWSMALPFNSVTITFITRKPPASGSSNATSR